ncbi:O-antigen ligase family protein [Shewanella abyssi]|uniref:O-antigen ligase family protein n=1 Tax=Shewanella abyssi TaxID=311789 RepID=UPI002010C216|nr:O-antigen ligase family protein [Shewanella abyssi]MCL1048191.1 O-antigen ligase family protein [Shewanella abyssi]
MVSKNAEDGFLSLRDADRVLALILVLFSMSILLIGYNTSFKTGLYVTIYQITFIVTYMVLCHKFDSSLSTIVKGTILKNKLTIVVLLLYSLYLTSYLINLTAVNSETHKVAMSLRFLFLSSHIFFTYVLLCFFINTSNRIANTFSVVPITVIIIIICILLVYVSFDSPQINFTITTIPFATNIRHLGYIATIGSIVASIKLLLLSNRTKYKLNLHMGLWSLLLALNIAFLFWLGGRASIVSYFFSLLTLTVILKFKHQLSLKTLLYLFFLICLGIALSTVFSIYPWNGILRVQESLQNVSDINDLSSNRLQMWQNSITYGLEKMWLGHGPDAYRFMPTKTAGVQPHNIFLQVFLEAGVLGLMVFLVILLSTLFRAISLIWISTDMNQDESIYMAFAILVSLTIYGTLSGAYYHAQPLYFLMISFAAVGSFSIKKDIV